jgi:hypothetical protein
VVCSRLEPYPSPLQVFWSQRVLWLRYSLQSSIVVVLAMRPNLLINETSNGKQPLSGGVRLVHSTPPVADNMPLRAGCQERWSA